MPPGKITSAKPRASSSAAGSGRRLAALDHVRHQRQRAAQSGDHAGEIVVCLRRLDEQHVDAGFAVHGGPFDGALEAFDPNGVGAGDDQRLARASRIERGAQLAAHFGRGDQRLAVEMAAAFGKVLILELDRVGAGAFEFVHCADHIERVAVTVVAIDDEMRADTLADQRQRLGDLGHADEPDVGAPEPRIGDRRARDIKRGESGLGRDQGGERVVDAGRHHDWFAGESGDARFPHRPFHVPTVTFRDRRA